MWHGYLQSNGFVPREVTWRGNRHPDPFRDSRGLKSAWKNTKE